MLKVLSNLKKSMWSVILIVILLCVQATTDLALPDYTSKIVNIGIQAGGIKEPIPEILAKEDMEKLLILTNQKDEILAHYTLVDTEKISKQEEKIIYQYLGKEKEIKTSTIYIIKEMEKEEKQKLSKIMANGFIKLAILEREEIQKIPQEQKEKVLQTYTNEIDQMQDSIKEQAAIGVIKGLYQKLGVDMNRLQNNYILKTGLQMLLIASITMISAISIMLLSSRVAAKLGKTLRVFNSFFNYKKYK